MVAWYRKNWLLISDVRVIELGRVQCGFPIEIHNVAEQVQEGRRRSKRFELSAHRGGHGLLERWILNPTNVTSDMEHKTLGSLDGTHLVGVEHRLELQPIRWGTQWF